MVKTEIAWHYTTGEVLVKIAKSQELRPATAYVPKHERPILWFSFNPEWEETANKGIIENGKNRTVTRQEMIASGVGLVRFGIYVFKKRDYYRDESGVKFFGWPKLARKAKMSVEVRKGLELRACDVGANPCDWVGMFSSMPLDHCNKLEVLNEEEKWVDIHSAVTD